MKLAFIALCAVLVLVIPAVLNDRNTHRDPVYRIASSKPSPTPTAAPSMPQAHATIRLPGGLEQNAELEAVLDRAGITSDPTLLAALQSGKLTEFETASGHPPVKWTDSKVR